MGKRSAPRVRQATPLRPRSPRRCRWPPAPVCRIGASSLVPPHCPGRLLDGQLKLGHFCFALRRRGAGSCLCRIWLSNCLGNADAIAARYPPYIQNYDSAPGRGCYYRDNLSLFIGVIFHDLLVAQRRQLCLQGKPLEAKSVLLVLPYVFF